MCDNAVEEDIVQIKENKSEDYVETPDIGCEDESPIEEMEDSLDKIEHSLEEQKSELGIEEESKKYSQDREYM